jgi:regulator of replication initiation timing
VKSVEFSAQQDPRTREDDEVAPKPKKSAKNAYSRTTVRGKSDTVEKGDERVAELQAMVEKLMAENKRLRAELNELRDDGGPAKVKDPSRNYRSEVEGQYRKLFGDKRAAGEKGDGKWKLDGAVEQKVLLEQELKQEIDGQQKEGKARQRRLEEATGRHKELLQQKLKQAIAEKEEHVLKLQLKELAEQIDESAQEQKLKEVIVQEIEEARKRAEVDNKRERDDGGKDDAK